MNHAMNLVLGRKATLCFLALSLYACVAGAKCERTPIHPDASYFSADQSDGSEVVDRTTSFVWQRCLAGKVWNKASQQCTGTALSMTWQASVDYVKTLPGSKTNPWRIPSHFELMTLVDLACSEPALNTKWFGDPDSTFLWAASSYAPLPDYAWGLKYGKGELTYEIKSNEFQLRLVRSAN